MKFLFNTRTDWDEPPRARHQLAEALANKHEVVFIANSKMGVPSWKNERINTNLKIITPKWFINGKLAYRIPLLNELFQLWLLSNLKKKYENYHVINFDPSASFIHLFFKNVIYFCTDDFLNTKRSKSILISIYISLTQKIVAKHARFCLGVSYYLKDNLLRYNENSYLFLTAAPDINSDVFTFDDGVKEHFNIVYVGWLFKLNQQWILEIAKNKKYTIYLIGPTNNVNVEGFQSNSNIIITGAKKGDELYRYVERADVCIAPYSPDQDTEEVYTMPNKFWLYLVFGKPIVTCEIKNLYKEIPDKFIYQASSSLDFIKKIETSITENNSILTEKRKQFIQQNTWESRAKQFLILNNNG